MFWPFVVNGVLKIRLFLENEFLEQMPWNFKCFLCHLFNLKLFYMNLYENIAIVKWRVFNIDSKEGLCCQFQNLDKKSPSDWFWLKLRSWSAVFFWKNLSCNVLKCLIFQDHIWKKLDWILSDETPCLQHGLTVRLHLQEWLQLVVICSNVTWKWSLFHDSVLGPLLKKKKKIS